MSPTPRRCSSRWLDGDCPSDVLAIIDHGASVTDRYDVIYAPVQSWHYVSGHSEHYQTFISVTDAGRYYHGEMKTHEVAAYRYRMKHRYAKWSTLPDAVKIAVRSDLAAMTVDA